MTEVPPEPIESPDDQDIEPPPSGICHELIERDVSILRTAHALIDILPMDRPSSRRDISTQFEELILAGLVGSRDPRVQGRPHHHAHTMAASKRRAAFRA